MRRVKANFIPKKPSYCQFESEEEKEEDEPIKSHTYEWKRNLASQVKLRLIQQKRDFQARVLEVSLNMSMPNSFSSGRFSSRHSGCSSSVDSVQNKDLNESS